MGLEQGPAGACSRAEGVLVEPPGVRSGAELVEPPGRKPSTGDAAPHEPATTAGPALGGRVREAGFDGGREIGFEKLD